MPEQDTRLKDEWWIAYTPGTSPAQITLRFTARFGQKPREILYPLNDKSLQLLDATRAACPHHPAFGVRVAMVDKIAHGLAWAGPIPGDSHDMLVPVLEHWEANPDDWLQRRLPLEG